MTWTLETTEAWLGNFGWCVRCSRFWALGIHRETPLDLAIDATLSQHT